MAWGGIAEPPWNGVAPRIPAEQKGRHLANAERYVADGKYPEAVIEYRNAAKIDGPRYEAVLSARLLASSANGRTRFDDAEQAITTAKQAYPTELRIPSS